MDSQQQTKVIPFDLSKAKTKENPKGLKVVTLDGHKCRILDTERKDPCYNIVVAIEFTKDKETIIVYKKSGRIENEDSFNEHPKDLRLIQPVTKRLMTNQELSWWLNECPEEHREYKKIFDGVVYSKYDYLESYQDKEVSDQILIRSNGGEWRELLIEVKD